MNDQEKKNYLMNLTEQFRMWKSKGLIKGFYVRPSPNNNTIEISIVPAYELTWLDCSFQFDPDKIGDD